MLRKIYSFIILGVFLTVILLAGCAGKDNPKAVEETNKTESKSVVNPMEQTVTKSSTEKPEEEKQPDISTEEATVTETKKKDEQLEAFAETVQEAVSDRDLEALSDLLSYPCVFVTVDQETISIKKKEDLIKQNPDMVFGDDLMIAVATVDTATLNYSGDGIVLGEGSSHLIFRKMETGGFGITEIRE